MSSQTAQSLASHGQEGGQRGHTHLLMSADGFGPSSAGFNSVSAQTFPLDNPELVFSNCSNLFLSSGLRHLIKFDVSDGLRQIAHFDFGKDGVKAFAGFDEASRTVWAVAHRSNTLYLLDENLNLMRKVSIPKNEGFFFSYGGESFLIDAYTPPYNLYRLTQNGLAPHPAIFPGTPFAHEFLGQAYGHSCPVFYYYSSRILMAFDGASFQRVARVQALNGSIQGSVACFEPKNISLTMSNDSLNNSRILLSILDPSGYPLSHTQIENGFIGSSFCVADGKILIMSHQHSQLYIVPLHELRNSQAKF